MERVHEIYITDGGAPIRASRCSEDGVGVRYTDDEGRQVRVPWGRVERVVTSRLVEDPAEVEPVDEPTEPDEEGEVADGSDSEPDDKGGKVSEWAETDPAEVREWAKGQGLSVSDSGPISKAVLTKYAAAHS